MKLITWNIQWGRGVDGRVDLDRIVDDARRVADFDVLCLQEVSAGYPALAGCDGSDQFRALSDRLPDYTAVAGIATDTPSADRHQPRRVFGNLLLSRWPVLQVLRHLLPWPAHDGVKSMQRIALEATLRTPSGPLRVTTTHLEYYSPLQRDAQVERLRELQREAVAQARCQRLGSAADGPFAPLPRGGPAILTGDFNCDPVSPEVARLQLPIDSRTPRYIDAWRLVHGTAPHAPTVGVHDVQQWPGGPQAFDYVFVGEDLAPRVDDLVVEPASAASDHQPVLLVLR